jgi:RimJ/RimL family protein N-acetyltransferase
VTAVLRSAESVPGLTLLLRPWDSRDIPQLLEIYSDPAMRRSSANPLATEHDAYRWLDVQQQGWTSGRRLSFAVLDSASGTDPGLHDSARVLGNVVLKEWQPGKDAAEVGYWTAPAARNRGIASEAVKMLTAWAFESFGAQGLERIELYHRLDNLASCRVAQKSGYAFAEELAADPPAFPSPGHLHIRHSAGR